MDIPTFHPDSISGSSRKRSLIRGMYNDSAYKHQIHESTSPLLYNVNPINRAPLAYNEGTPLHVGSSISSHISNKRRKIGKIDDDRVSSLETTIKQDHETITTMKKENNKLSISLESHKQQVKKLEEQLTQLQQLQQLQHEDNVQNVDVINDDKTCVICMDNKKDHVIVPCGHACLCGDCVEMFKDGQQKCPLCKADIMTVTKVYF